MVHYRRIRGCDVGLVVVVCNEENTPACMPVNRSIEETIDYDHCGLLQCIAYRIDLLAAV
jgi:hypothetical protein